jgi:pyruvate dehydrogenase E2 component (dihydrolipoamide acetyltransferase)
MTVFKLPDLGEGLSEAEVLHWHVQAGDRIEVDAPLLAVETAKAVVEVPSPWSGTIRALYARPGDRVETGAPLVEFAEPAIAEPAIAEPAMAEPAVDSGTVVGHMPAVAEGSTATAALLAADTVITPRVRAVPAARALARSLGVDVAAVRGTGRGGLVTLDDVMAVGLPARAAASTMHPHLPPDAAQPPGNGAEGGVEVLRSLRRAMAQSMTLSRDSVMECSVFDDADLHRWRGANDYTTRVLRAIAAGARSEPGLNAWYDAGSQCRTLFEHVHVGLAVDTPDGLLVPVIRNVEALEPAALRAELDRLKGAARERKLSSDELRHFTFILSNFGMLAGRYATPVVVPPAVAILGTGRARPDVVAFEGQVAVHSRMPLSLTFDHRVVTGGEAVRFLGALISDLELPE